MEFLKVLTVTLTVLVTVCYAYQIVYLFVPFFRKDKPHKPAKQTRYAILIAARNEEAVLPYLLRSIRAQDYPAELFTTYVIADNCTDRTAQVAEEGGAVVFTRTDPHRVGKGYALRYLLKKIDLSVGLSRYDAFLIFDADNLLEPDYITQINRVCSDGYDAFCGFRNTKNFGTNWISSGHSLWYLHDCIHLSRSRHLLGNPCAVTGTGYGFTRQLLERLGGWEFLTLTEDIEFSVWCATHGVRVGYCHDAVLYDEQPECLRQSIRQRIRWTQGTIQVSVRYCGDMLCGMTKGGRTGWASLEAFTLSIWGYGLCILNGVLSMAVTLLSFGWQALLPGVLCCVLSAYGSLLFLACMTVFPERRRIHAAKGALAKALFTFPLYMATFIPVFFGALFHRFSWPPIEHNIAVSNEELQATK